MAEGSELESDIASYIEHLKVIHHTEDTVSTRRYCLKLFCEWCGERGLEKPSEIIRPIVERYQRYLFNYRKAGGKPLAISTQRQRLKAIRGFFSWLIKQNMILHNPTADIEMPRIPKNIPHQTLSVAEVEKIMSQPDLASPSGQRDRAIMEILYSSGIRRAELLKLSIYDIDFERGILVVNGKGRKQRIVPLGERALNYLQFYISEGRDKLLRYNNNILFPGESGDAALTRNYLTALMREYIRKAGVNKKGACHIFRHSVATLMLENGADIRYIQQMLGHASLESTQIYTQVSIKQLKNVHRLTHPGSSQKSEEGPQKSD